MWSERGKAAHIPSDSCSLNILLMGFSSLVFGDASALRFALTRSEDGSVHQRAVPVEQPG